MLINTIVVVSAITLTAITLTASAIAGLAWALISAAASEVLVEQEQTETLNLSPVERARQARIEAMECSARISKRFGITTPLTAKYVREQTLQDLYPKCQISRLLLLNECEKALQQAWSEVREMAVDPEPVAEPGVCEVCGIYYDRRGRCECTGLFDHADGIVPPLVWDHEHGLCPA